MQTKEKLSRREMLTFASGDIFGGGAQIIINFYYLIFLTDVVKIRPALAGTVVLLSKFWDAILDPIMGVITDNTHSRFGRRKPYFLAGVFAVVISFFLLWYPVSSANEMLRFVYVLITYLLYNTVYTMVVVPYSAMSSEISADSQERNHVNGIRLFVSQFSSLLCAVLPIEIVKHFPDVRTGYIVMAICFGLFFALPYLLIFFFTKERVVPATEKSKLDLSIFIKPFQIRSFRILVSIYLSAFLAMDVVSNIFSYYMKYYLKRPSELNLVLGAMLITQISLVAVVIKLASKIGKARTIMLSTLIWGAAVFCMALLQPNWPQWAIYADAVLMGCGIIGCVVIPWIMYPDVTDVGELALGKRSAGSFSGIMTFTRKFSSAIAIFAVSCVLDLSGYIQPTQKVLNGVSTLTLMQQPASVLHAIKIIMVAFPLILLIFTFCLSRIYPLTAQRHEKLAKHLEYTRNGLSESPVTAQELDELRKTLV